MKLKDLHLLFSDHDIRAIEESIRRVENVSPVEIVPYVTKSSDDYLFGYWKALAVSSLLGLVFGNLWIALGLVAMLMLSYALIHRFRRWVIGKDELDERVWRKAKELFLEEEIFLTKNRMGVLILISLFEHEVAILCDSGLYGLTTPETWKKMSNDLAKSMKVFDPTPTLIRAIEDIGAISQKTPFKGDEPNPNELSNRLRFEQDP